MANRLVHGLFGAVVITAAVFGLAAARHAGAQGEPPAGFAENKVISLIKMDLTGVPNRQVIANIYEVAPGVMVPRHFHHGDEFHYVLSGEWAAEVEGQPMHIMKAGDSQYVPSGRWHGGRVSSAGPMRLLGLMIVEKDKPVVETKQ